VVFLGQKESSFSDEKIKIDETTPAENTENVKIVPLISISFRGVSQS
jgi:hypothetical protein